MREVHGIASSAYSMQRRALVVQGHKAVKLDLCAYSEIDLTPDEARHLAQKLTRLAKRVEDSQEPTT
jgi:hypothetical protein